MGHCIPDDLYELGYEGFSAAAVMETIPGLAELYGVSLVSVNLGRRHVTTPEQKFLNEMQYHLHDAFMQRELERCLYKNNPEETMEEAFREFASTYSMVMPAKEG